MSDLPQRIEAHLIQCHRLEDDSERLLVEAKAEIARLDHEMEATKEAARAREAMLREGLECLERGDDSIDGMAADIARSALDRAALSGESRQ